MGQPYSTKQTNRFTALFLLCSTMFSCTERNLYDPEWNAVPPVESYFGYEMRGDIKLSINYNASGFIGLVEVYDQDPMENNLKKEGLAPIYAAFINDGKLERTMYVPTNVKQAYLYTSKWGLPECVKMEVTSSGITYDATKVGSRVTSRAEEGHFGIFKGDRAPYTIWTEGSPRADNLMAVYKWQALSWGESYTSGTTPYATTINTVGSENVSTFVSRVQKTITETLDKKSLLRDAGVTNIVVAESGTTLDFVFLAERGAFHNTVGYYYYPTNTPPTSGQLNSIKKYILLPAATDEASGKQILASGTVFKLKFFGASGTDVGVDEFPAGYTVGWFFIADAYKMDYDNIKYTSPSDQFASNDTGDKRRFIALNDSKSGAVVMGFEDSKTIQEADDYSDVLFFVKSNKDISNEERPEIEPEPPVVFGTETRVGTLAFEDLWPSGGDYDMNDVVIEYSRAISFTKENKVTQVVETFKTKSIGDNAVFNNYFGFQMTHLGTVTTSSDAVVVENTSSSIIISKSAKEQLGEVYSITRTGLIDYDKDVVLKDFNPYIIIGSYTKDTPSRKEVHLPKYQSTSLADKGLNNTIEDAYYIKRDGSFPFAIDIPMLNFNLATEKMRIDEEYPKFRTWVDSNGAEGADWYLIKGQ